MENIIIITGGSKGIGRGIVTAYQAQGYHIFSIARTKGKFEDDKGIIQIQADLSDEKVVGEVLPLIFKQIDQNCIKRIVLINNAGSLGEVGRLENLSAQKISSAVKLNTLTPLLLVSTFISLTKAWNCERRVINISSGAAQNPYYGWSIYCATKAALDMMTKVVAAEQETIENGVNIISLSPGVVDTDMQTEIRKHSREEFIAIDRFLELKASGSLLNPKVVGEKVFEIDQKDLENGAILRIEI